ncbi:PQQ-dependent sugar dehydrogenase [Nostoc linckia FACHB-104]|nr:PQQ-dependent sugar dehydrogenase [Nostoc linckia FACHB-104]
MATIRINAGGQAYTDSIGNLWLADQYFSGGNIYSTTAAIANTVEDSLYQNERWLNDFSYAIPVTNGDYTVKLKFAELFFTGAGQRVFDVNAEDQLKIDDLDIFKEAGAANTALDKSFTVKVTDGALNLKFLSSVNNAKVDAIEIIPLTTAPTAQVIVQQSGGNTAVTEGGTTDSYSLVLNSQPTANVTINLATTGNQVTLNKTSFTFTPSNWNTAQTVTVTAVNDTAVEGNHTANITHTVSSTDSKYNNLAVGNVAVTITDNDTAPTGKAIRINAGGAAYTDSQGNQWLADQYFSGGNTYATTAAIANTVEDPLYQNERWLNDFSYAIPVTNGDYTVKLKFAELFFTGAGQRVFDVNAEDQLKIDDLDIFKEAGAANTALDKSFTVKVADGTLNLKFLSSINNAKVDAIEIIPLTTTPTAQVIVQQSGGNTAVTEGGATDSYSLVLNSQPTANVTINLATTGNQVTLNKTSFTFTPSNWNIAQTVTVTAVNDTAVEGNHTANITHTVSSTDSKYNNLAVGNVAVTITDNDTAPTAQVIVQQSGGNTAVTEGGATDSYALVLNSQPTANVTINLATTGNQVTLNKTSFTFTPSNWNTAQTVTVTAVNDTAVEGTHTANITHTVSSTDSKYNNLAVGNVAVTITDNDTNPTPTPGAIRIDVGATKSFTDTKGQVWQADQYSIGTSNVYTVTAPIGKTEDDILYQTDRYAQNLAYEIPVANGNYTVNLHFSENYWTDFDQRVFDISLEGQKVFSNVDIFKQSKNAFFPGNNSALVLSVPTQSVSDGKLNLNLDASVNNATISAIEIIPVTGSQVILQQTGGSTAVAEGGAGDSYSLVLNSKPTTNVTINLVTDKANQITLNKSSFTFTPDNWNIAQAVTVNAVNDTTVEGNHTVNISHSVTSADSTYNNLSIPQVAVSIADNETVPISFTQKVVATINVSTPAGPTTGAWGPDGRLYVGDYDGTIRAYTFDQNYNVTNTQEITTLKGLYNSDILGLAFNPYDTSDAPSIYVAHSKLYANRGGAFPQTELSPYSGQVSILQGTNFSQLIPLVTGLPTSNHDHGINGLTFDNKGDLYINVGGNTNAGITNDNIGGIPESPFSAAILKAEISKPTFNGKVQYSLPSNFQPPAGLTFDPAISQVFGDKASVKPGVDVSVYASGLRNPYDAVFSTKGLLYATDNGHNPGFGDISTSATTQKPATGAPDELNLIEQGNYYGSPNRNRGVSDPRQNVYYDPSQASIPGVYTAPIATNMASTNGIDEYRATTFNNQLRGNLITQRWNAEVSTYQLSADGKKVQKIDTINNVGGGLDILTGPGGALVGINYSDKKITVATPNDSAAIGVTAYDIFPWRAPANNDAGKNTFVIGGKNFGTLANTQVIIGGKTATLTEVSSERIKGILPSFSNTNPIDLLDVTINSKGQFSTIADAYLPLYGSATFV